MTDRTPSGADVVAAIPENIRAELARRQMSIEAAARHLKMSDQAFRRRQVRPAMWTYQELVSLAAVLDVPVWVLVGGER